MFENTSKVHDRNFTFENGVIEWRIGESKATLELAEMTEGRIIELLGAFGYRYFGDTVSQERAAKKTEEAQAKLDSKCDDIMAGEPLRSRAGGTRLNPLDAMVWTIVQGNRKAMAALASWVDLAPEDERVAFKTPAEKRNAAVEWSNATTMGAKVRELAESNLKAQEALDIE